MKPLPIALFCLASISSFLPLSACMSSSQSASLAGKAAPELSVDDKQADILFKQPYIDIDEWRELPVPHRYIHGGFGGTTTRFSYYFPPIDAFEGRFFQHITPVPDSENLAQRRPLGEYNNIEFAIDSGAYFVETNGGGDVDYTAPMGTRMDPSITAYRANAAAARYSRTVAQSIYPTKKRPYGYAYGGSGGGYRTIGAIENTRDIWDGVVPYVIGSTMAIPNMFTVRMHAMRVIGDKFSQIVDAVDAGGNADPYVSLDAEEADALREVTKMGFPIESWFEYDTMGVHGFAALYQGMRAADPTYFTDFWTTPGYLGYDRPRSFERDRLQFTTRILAPITAAQAAHERINTNPFNAKNDTDLDRQSQAHQGPDGARIIGFRLAETPPATNFLGGDLIITSGEYTGEELTVANIVDDIVILGMGAADRAGQLKIGDQVRVDNINFLAAQTYHRHQVPGTDFPVWDQFRKADGTPKYPQRPMLISPLFVQATAGSQMTGRFKGKMIVVAALWDREAMPWQADWYRQRVAKQLGNLVDDQFRLYYTDRALHGDEPEPLDSTQVVPYQGMLQQALRDVAAWAEAGTAPPQSTRYKIDDGQIEVPSSATQRKGLQPVVKIDLNAAARLVVARGTTVDFQGTISAPPGTGSIVLAEWDFGGQASYPFRNDITYGEREISINARHTFDTAGTFFVVLRGASQRQGNGDTPFGVIRNLDRVRVIVK